MQAALVLVAPEGGVLGWGEGGGAEFEGLQEVIGAGMVGLQRVQNGRFSHHQPPIFPICPVAAAHKINKPQIRLQKRAVRRVLKTKRQVTAAGR